TDLCAAVALAQIRKYEASLLPRRRQIYGIYERYFSSHDWAKLQPSVAGPRQSANHLLMLQVLDFNEAQRDRLIQEMGRGGVATNVHFVPLPRLSLFAGKGYRIEDFPVADR